MLAEELGTASNIKSSANRKSVVSAITSVQARLKLYSRLPPNGLVIFCGTVATGDGKFKKLNIDFEPFKSIKISLYHCDSRFHVEAIRDMIDDEEKFGFIIMDGNGCLFGTLQGNNRQILHKLSVELPKKHGRGGQSAERFARHRVEVRHNYLRKVSEMATQHFISMDSANVSGLILAGIAQLKSELILADFFDPRLRCKILKVVDIAYGGENGFNQAIVLAGDILRDVTFMQEKQLLGKYFDEIARNTDKYSFGIDNTIKALEVGAVETLICWENLDLTTVELRNKETSEITFLHLTQTQLDQQLISLGSSATVVESQPFIDWLLANYRNFGAKLEFVSDKSTEGTQFVRGFMGFGGILRFPMEFAEVENLDEGFDTTEYDY